MLTYKLHIKDKVDTSYIQYGQFQNKSIIVVSWGTQ